MSVPRFIFYGMEVGRHPTTFCFRSLKEDLEKKPENQDNVAKCGLRVQGVMGSSEKLKNRNFKTKTLEP
jgi:hypothetical protein